MGDGITHRITPAARLHDRGHAFGFNRGVADDPEQLFMRPDIIFMGRDVEIANQHGRGLTLACGPCLKLIEEAQFMIEFRVGLTIRDITTSRNVEIVDIDPAFEGDSLMPAILPPNPVEVTVIMQRLAGNDGNAVIALFTPDRLMRIASLTDGFTRKGIIRAFGFLPAT